ncbi:MAG: SPFH domain-containing protein [Planctomycetes bacterium]|nr:SPFH domain-containing protein [Planctomycetota bacterium]
MQTRNPSKETAFHAFSGAAMLVFELLLFAGALTLLIHGGKNQDPFQILAAIPLFLTFILCLPGFFIVEPNMGRAIVLVGRYRGTVRASGFYWTNPFTSKKKISLRAHNLNGKTLKVNDLAGNPIEIAVVVVWQVHDSAQALFDVEEFEHFVEVQAEAAVRLVASRHPYDDGQSSEVETTLRGSADAVAAELSRELQLRIELAGIQVLEARLSHLAYAQEIAHAMLQRQQAGAIIAARTRIVDGAVGMVEMALERLNESKIVDLDPERRATLVGNLLVVLCGQQSVSPVLNTGGLYS